MTLNSIDDLPVITHKKNGQYYCYVPGTGVVTNSDKIEDAFQKLGEQISRLEGYRAELGLDVAPNNKSAQFLKSIREDLLIFFIKTGIVALVAVLILVLFLPAFSAIVRHEVTAVLPETAPKKLLIELPEKINARFNSLSPDERRRFRESWQSLYDNLSPIIPPNRK